MSSHSLFALSFLVVVQTGCYYYFKTYRGVWRYSSLDDVARILKASITAVVLVIPALYLSSILQHLPRAIFPLYCLIVATFLCGGRLLIRLHWDRRGRTEEPINCKRVLIIGAGQAGESLVRDLKRGGGYLPVGFIDDNNNKRGLEVHGVRVLGASKEIERLADEHAVDLIFIAIPSAGSATMRRIVTYCEATGVPFRTLPSISSLISGKVEFNALRPVSIEDLLGRDQVCLQWEQIAEEISGKRILVTGGGGSIGSELCRQVLSLCPELLLIVDNSEFNLYQIEQELRASFPSAQLEFHLINVTDSIAINHLLNRSRPQLIFHAAAYKHVPLLQHQVRAAVFNNVIGTQIVAKAAVEYKAEKFILISTDKAVKPTNIMGATKRVAEIFCQNLDTQVETRFITVRFGNVLGSAGSVIPLFQKQLLSGGPLTVTHPDMKRYFMTIPEATQLILQAMADGEGGEVFVLDMGDPIKISYLAEQMIRLSGKEPGKDVLIKYTGLRPGEKLYEELFHETEQLVPTTNEKLFKARFHKVKWDELMQVMRLLETACSTHLDEELLVLLQNLVPELPLHQLMSIA
jgi:FlaA1/EpsC-like NDP-sugar epimerase